MLKVTLVLFSLLPLASPATIRGAVVEQATGRPLAHSLVTVSTVGPERSAGGSITTRANSSGVFFFSGLHPGGYLLTGSRKGFATRRHGQKNWKAAGTPILLPAEDSTFIVELRLQRLGAITGAVWDENQVGLPEQDVAVYETSRPPKFLTRVRTDDRGIYRIGELEPGRYYVRARGSQFEEGSGPLPTFFKDSPGVEQAQMVDVDLDQQVVDVNMQPPVGKLFHITGSAPVPRQVMQVTVDLVSDMGTVSGSVDASGDSYVATISARGRLDASPAAANGWKEFSLAPGDRLSVKAVLSGSAAALSGRVTVSRDQPAAGAPVFLQPMDLEAGGGLTLKTTRTHLAGHYRFTALPPGRYLLLSSFDFERPNQDEMQAAHPAAVSVKEDIETNQDLELFISP